MPMQDISEFVCNAYLANHSLGYTGCLACQQIDTWQLLRTCHAALFSAFFFCVCILSMGVSYSTARALYFEVQVARVINMLIIG